MTTPAKFGICRLTSYLIVVFAFTLNTRMGLTATVYKCVDEQGKTSFSDRTCDDSQAQVVFHFKEQESDLEKRFERLASVLKTLEDSRKEREASRRRKREEQAEAAKANRETACAEALAQKALIGTSPDGQFYRRDPKEKDTVRLLSRPTAKVELRRLQQAMDKNCN